MLIKTFSKEKKTYIEFNFEIEIMFLNSTFKTASVSMYNFDEVQLNNFSLLTEYLIIISEEKKKVLIEKSKRRNRNNPWKKAHKLTIARVNIGLAFFSFFVYIY